MKRMGILTSGGDAPGMNAAIRAAVRVALGHKVEVFGIKHGYAGMLKGELTPLDTRSVAGIIHRGGTVLRTARSDEFKTPAGRARAMDTLREWEIGALVVIGGDGSFRGARELAQAGIAVIGVPATIDNDIPTCDYTIGFDTAVNTAVDAMNKIRDTAASHERTYVVEVMGRHSGELALFTGLAGGAESILIPEVEFDLEVVCRRVMEGFRRGRSHSIIVVAEGAKDGQTVGRFIKERTGFETRVTVLGHIQRGGSPSAFDRILASRMASLAVNLLLEGKTDLGTVLQGKEVKAVPLASILAGTKNVDYAVYELAGVLAI